MNSAYDSVQALYYTVICGRAAPFSTLEEVGAYNLNNYTLCSGSRNGVSIIAVKISTTGNVLVQLVNGTEVSLSRLIISKDTVTVLF